MTKTRLPGVLRSVISPVQLWLLSQGRCVGCGRNLSLATKSKTKTSSAGGGDKLICECGRIFIQDTKTKNIRRALLEEV